MGDHPVLIRIVILLVLFLHALFLLLQFQHVDIGLVVGWIVTETIKSK